MTQPTRAVPIVALAMCLLAVRAPLAAQTLGTFRWQLYPYCNILTLNVIQQGGAYTLSGVDEQCGAGQRASASGMAFANPDGSIGIGLTTVVAPGGVAVHIEARITLSSLSGPWRDSAGNSGTFVFTPGPGVPGPARPAPTNGVPPASITLAQLAPAAMAAIPPPSRFTFGPDGRIAAQEPVSGDSAVQLLWQPASWSFRAGSFHPTSSIGVGSWAGGQGTEASGRWSFAFGSHASARGNLSMTLGGSSHACGHSSVVLGTLASTSSIFGCGGTVFNNSFIFADGTTFTTLLGHNQFVVRATGGVSFWSTTTTAGCHLNAGAGAWSCASDRALKERFEPLDGEEVLRKVAAMPVETWSFKTEAGVRHAGPVAQDFRAAFGLGVDDKTINYTDINGINMRAIQALEARTRDLQDAVRDRDQRIGDLEARLAELERVLLERRRE